MYKEYGLIDVYLESSLLLVTLKAIENLSFWFQEIQSCTPVSLDLQALLV